MNDHFEDQENEDPGEENKTEDLDTVIRERESALERARAEKEKRRRLAELDAELAAVQAYAGPMKPASEKPTPQQFNQVRIKWNLQELKPDYPGLKAAFRAGAKAQLLAMNVEITPWHEQRIDMYGEVAARAVFDLRRIMDKTTPLTIADRSILQREYNEIRAAAYRLRINPPFDIPQI